MRTETQNMISRIQDQINTLQQFMNKQNQVNTKCVFVVQLNSLMNADKEYSEQLNATIITTSHKLIPTLFTMDQATQVMNKDWKNGDGEKVQPVVLTYSEYCETKIQEMENLINLLQSK